MAASPREDRVSELDPSTSWSVVSRIALLTVFVFFLFGCVSCKWIQGFEKSISSCNLESTCAGVDFSIYKKNIYLVESCLA